MSDDLTRLVQLFQNDMPLWAEKCVKIRTKSGDLVPFVLNYPQRMVHEELEKIKAQGLPVRIALCKGRQIGMSTYVAARFLHRATLFRGTAVFILTHMTKSTSHLFDMVKRMYKHLPDPLKPSIERSNRIELKFGAIDSEYALGTAGSEDIGRGMSPLLLHLSEAAMYANAQDLQQGLLQGVPNIPGSEIIYESTPNGINNWFYTLCMRGVDCPDASRIKTVFLPWYWMPEYQTQTPIGFRATQEELELMDAYNLTPEQIYWRRVKIEDDYMGDVRGFRREYPMTLMDGFISSGVNLIENTLIETAKKTIITPDPLAPKILGVDGAGDGTNRTVITCRQGKKVLWYKVYDRIEPMNLAGIIARHITVDELDMVFLDVAYGYGVRDRLRELGYAQKTMCVHFGEGALDPELYRNKRAQMYGYMKEWFTEGGADIPDDQHFGRDIAMIPDFKRGGSRGLFTLPSKDDIKHDNSGVSPDIADSLALTFAHPVMRRQGAAKVHATEVFLTKIHARGFGRRNRTSPITNTKPSELFVR
jgi:hypothetical protein